MVHLRDYVGPRVRSLAKELAVRNLSPADVHQGPLTPPNGTLSRKAISGAGLPTTGPRSAATATSRPRVQVPPVLASTAKEGGNVWASTGGTHWSSFNREQLEALAFRSVTERETEARRWNSLQNTDVRRTAKRLGNAATKPLVVVYQ
jgi:hypothetical protein